MLMFYYLEEILLLYVLVRLCHAFQLPILQLYWTRSGTSPGEPPNVPLSSISRLFRLWGVY